MFTEMIYEPVTDGTVNLIFRNANTLEYYKGTYNKEDRYKINCVRERGKSYYFTWCYADVYYQTRLKLILQEIENVKDSLLGSDCDGQLRYDISMLENIIEDYSVTARLK